MRVLIAGGGTGGHLFPAVALAEVFAVTDPEGSILFAGTDNPLEVSILSQKGFDHVSISAEGLKGQGLWRQAHALLTLPIGFWQAVRTIWRFKPDMTIGVGGYASGPVALAAGLMGKKMVIHEQNFLPGFTNKVLGRFAHRIFVSFPDDRGMFTSSRTVLTGNPVRQDVLEAASSESREDGFTVLVMGGSQGAHTINCAVVEALKHLDTPSAMGFIHQTGTKDVPWVTRAYKDHGIRAKVLPFIDDMAGAYRASDLVVCRAGASTVAELAALGKPALFIPFPYAANNHQELNARYVANRGGGEVMLEKDLNGESLARKIGRYESHREALQDMSVQASTLGRPDAAEAIVDECTRLVSGGD
ncbi:MAG: undecaprenyldiphospho-muramoylpentapeptide beta-N-acetylglucosaminyltransferase [Thermodesulfobacteriota bacterium]|nr:undecaprenyldiphospho-muramoylpentapeptide beta-N-acetylglucosaminyltransferase [Thermodesulfobacteriota bacterium]